MEECHGCKTLTSQIERLADDIEELQMEYKGKVKEFDSHKGDINIKLVGIEHKLDTLSSKLINHMTEEMETQKKTAVFIESASKFITEMSADRKYIMLILAGISGAIIWFYTQQYLPQMIKITEALTALK